MPAGSQWNARNSAVKRIVQELKEIQNDDNPDIVAEALEDNIFEWHFAIRGAWDSDYEGGIYHGRILMPAEYPFKPPAFVMLTPSGRFATDTKICLSISSFHPESWQPSWSVRSALIALIAFMQTSGDGAIGSIEVSPEIRRQMAIEARITPPKHANAERQELIKRMHAQMLDMEDRSRAIHKADAGDLVGSELVELNEEQGEPTAKPNRDISKDSASSSDGTAMEAPKEGEGVQDPEPVIPEPVPAAVPTLQTDAPSTTSPPHQRGVANGNWNWEDRGLAYLAMVLLLLLLALVARRIFLAFNSQPRFASHSWSSTGIDFRDVGDL